MKHCLLLTLLLTVSASAHALNGRDCLAQSAGLNEQERTNFLVGCLAKASSPANVEQVALRNRHLHCERNAENLELRGVLAGSYINTCMNTNEAKEAWEKFAEKHKSPVFASNSEE